MHRLLFHETIIVNEAQQAYYRRNGDMKRLYVANYAALWNCLMLVKPAFIGSKMQKKNIILWNIITI